MLASFLGKDTDDGAQYSQITAMIANRPKIWASRRHKRRMLSQDARQPQESVSVKQQRGCVEADYTHAETSSAYLQRPVYLGDGPESTFFGCIPGAIIDAAI